VSQENVDLTKRVIDAFNRRDVDGIVELAGVGFHELQQPFVDDAGIETRAYGLRERVDALRFDLLDRRVGERVGDQAGAGERAGVERLFHGFDALGRDIGEAIEAAAARAPIPVLKPNEAMFEAALTAGRRIGMLATFAPSVASMEQEFRAMAETHRSPATIETYCVPGAMSPRLRAPTSWRAHGPCPCSWTNASPGRGTTCARPGRRLRGAGHRRLRR